MTRKKFEHGRGYAREDWDAVSDNPPWTDAELAAARPFSEVLPDLADTIKRTRGPQKHPTKERITLRLDRGAVAAFRATGPGWQRRIDDVVKRAAKKLSHKV